MGEVREQSAMERYIEDFARGRPAILTPDYPRFKAFFDLLVWKLSIRDRKCDHSFKWARFTLSRMTCVDVDGTIEAMQKNGAHCDCEVILNVGLGESDDKSH